jgi:hypothetical protein
MTIIINSVEFELVGYSEAEFNQYQEVIKGFARYHDRPLQRFCSRLGNISAEDRASAIAGFMARDDWNEPTPDVINHARRRVDGVAALCGFVLRQLADNQKPSQAYLEELIKDNQDAVLAQVKAALAKFYAPPTDADIIAKNEELRKRLTNNVQ